MTNVAIRPFDQSIRIAALRASCLTIHPVALIVSPLNEEKLVGEIMTHAGLFLILILILILACVLGRFWSILYIGGFENAAVVQGRPYSICRHPLYLFSIIGTVGFGLMLQSFVLTTLIGATEFLILTMTARREEAFLESKFGFAYVVYASTTPRIIPDISLFSTGDDVVFGVRHLRNNFFDALVFLALIPMSEIISWLRDVVALPAIILI